jgi:L-amino acid N-acyltransferase YncA
MIRPAQESDAGAIAAILNHWILNTAVTFNPVPKTEAEVREMLATKAAVGHGFFVA